MSLDTRSMNYFPGVVSEPPYRGAYTQQNYVASTAPGGAGLGGALEGLGLGGGLGGMSSWTLNSIGKLVGFYLAWNWVGGIAPAMGLGCKVPSKGPGK